MISFNGYNDIIQKVYDTGNEHIFIFWDDLDENERRVLLDDLSSVDFTLLKSLFENRHRAESFDFSPAPYISRNDENRADARERGEEFIRSGKAAAFVVAGGQGSRLGYDGPKGKFPVGPLSHKTLFEIHGEKIKKYGEKYNVSIPWLIMTSRDNHEETTAYFSDMNFFGLDPRRIKIFTQNMIPSLDSRGKLLLGDKKSLFKNPDGHGGSLSAIASSGALDWLLSQGIEVLSYFQVDNPLVKIIDPFFFGYHVMKEAEISSKCLMKTGPDEKVGVFALRDDGCLTVVEYSDLSDEKASMKNDDGELLYSAGSPAIHLFSVPFIDSVTRGELSLPFHTAKKKLSVLTKEGVEEIEGFKFEKFVFDALPLAKTNVILEGIREEEFAPVKNRRGVDSLESSQELILSLHMKWLKEAGCTIPSGKKVELSPLLAVGPEDLDRSLELENNQLVYID